MSERGVSSSFPQAQDETLSMSSTIALGLRSEALFQAEHERWIHGEQFLNVSANGRLPRKQLLLAAYPPSGVWRLWSRLWSTWCWRFDVSTLRRETGQVQGSPSTQLAHSSGRGVARVG